MADIIQVRYDLLSDVQKRLQKQADAVEGINNSIKREVQELSHTWVGSAATSFFNEIQGEIYPAFNRLNQVLIESADVTGQIATTFRQAEEEAAKLFKNPFADMLVCTPQAKPGQGLIGWLSNTARDAGKALSEAGKDAWSFIEDHRDEIAINAAFGVTALAAAATIATGGAASPLLFAALGATTAGGITLAINGASAKYPWHDGVLSNTIQGAIEGALNAIGAGEIKQAGFINKLTGINTILSNLGDRDALPEPLARANNILGMGLSIKDLSRDILSKEKPLTLIKGLSDIVANDLVKEQFPQYQKGIELINGGLAIATKDTKGILSATKTIFFGNQIQPCYSGGSW